MTLFTDEARTQLDLLRTSPDDADAWRVLADLLTGQGDERGELIRLEQKLQNTAVPASERSEWQRQVAILKETHHPKWLEGLSRPEWATFSWQHGFVVGVRSEWNDDALAFIATLRAHSVGALLRALDLSENNLGVDGARAIADADVLRTLTELDLTINNLGDEGVTAIAASDDLRSLTVLRLAGNQIGAEGAKAIADADSLRALTDLELGGNNLDDDGAAAIAASSVLRSLTTLDLAGNNIGDEGAVAIAAATTLRALTELDLSGNRIRNRGKAALADSEHLRGCAVRF